MTILFVTVLVALPALRGQLTAYLDNPVHLAEIRDLARSTSDGWSDLGYCGFPLHILQSPLIFNALALLSRWGGPLEPIYEVLTVVSLAAPAFAFYYLARKRLSAAWSLGLSCTIVLYRGSLVGGAAALGGMFTFHLAGAAFLLVLDILARRKRALRDVVLLAMLAGFIGLTHMYITIALVYLGVIHACWSLMNDRANQHRLLYDLPGLALGATTAAAYWLPNVLAGTHVPGTAESMLRIAGRLVTGSFPLPPSHLYGLTRFASDPILHLDVLPQFAVLTLGLLGFTRATREADDVPRYGAVLAVLFLVLMAAQSLTGLAMLGPQSIRLIWIVKIGMLAASIPLVSALSQKVSLRHPTLALTCGCAVIFGILSGHIVAHEALRKDDPELANVRQLWSWLRNHKTASWGRVYLQDTFGNSRSGQKLGQSHVLAQTAERAGLEQVGAFYGSTPYVKNWIYGEGTYLFGLEATSTELLNQTVSRMKKASASHLVVVDDSIFERFQRDDRFTPRARIGRFLVLELRGAPARWATALDGDDKVLVDRLEPGRIRVRVLGAAKHIAVSEAFHPFWRIEPNDTASIHADADGLMVVDRVGEVGGNMELVYRPPSMPNFVTFAGVSANAALFVVDALGRRRRRQST